MGDHRVGAVYILFGEVFFLLGTLSIRSLREKNPDIGVHVITNIKHSDFLNLIAPGVSVSYYDVETDRNRHYKTSIYDLSPFELSIYIDADTLILSSINEMVFYLTHFDVCFQQKHLPYPATKKGRVNIFNGKFQVKDVPSWSGGVFMFRRGERVRDFFSNWNSLFHSLGSEFDQPSLAQALIESDCRILSLEQRWNQFDSTSRFRDFRSRSKWPVIVHYASRFPPRLMKELLLIQEEYSQFSGKSVDVLTLHFKNERAYRDAKLGFLKNRALRAIDFFKDLS